MQCGCHRRFFSYSCYCFYNKSIRKRLSANDKT
uniref:ZF-HD protein dimerization region protein n=1 Tax=Podoviridae sp. ctrTt13 TaxID=2825279 RepID=A0A8S5NSG4_9CAUD|nr:MAG TPA: ZF-HD protein dimerization region protein [Podoviridae sp. ctrTt13]